MAERKQLDWSKTGTVDGMAAWLRKQSGAVLVVVVRAEDAVVAVDTGVRPDDVEGVLYAGLPDAVERLRAKHQAERTKQLLRQDRNGGVAA